MPTFAGVRMLGISKALKISKRHTKFQVDRLCPSEDRPVYIVLLCRLIPIENAWEAYCDILRVNLGVFVDILHFCLKQEEDLAELRSLSHFLENSVHWLLNRAHKPVHWRYTGPAQI